MKRALWTLVFAGAFALATLTGPLGPALADHSCNGNVTQLDTPAGTFYVDDRDATGDPLEIWVYQETNGMAGLQSGGRNALYEDDCEHPIPDTLIF